jgi:hypothetical protein
MANFSILFNCRDWRSNCAPKRHRSLPRNFSLSIQTDIGRVIKLALKPHYVDLSTNINKNLEGSQEYKLNDSITIPSYFREKHFGDLGYYDGEYINVDSDGIYGDRGWHKIVGIENVSPSDFIYDGLVL